MNILNVVLLLVAFSPAALGTCYRGGYKTNFDRKNRRIVNLEALCAYMAGEFKNFDSKKVCMTDNEGKKWDFELQFKREDQDKDMTRTIDVKECLNGMEKEASCKYGGRQYHHNWYYRADPNLGTCATGPIPYGGA